MAPLVASVTTELVAALIGAGLGGAISLFTFYAARTRENNNDLREQLLELTDLRSQWYSMDMTAPNAVDKASVVNGKRLIRLAMATELADKLKKSMSIWDAVTLGSELDQQGDFRTSQRFFELAVKKARKDTPVMQAVAERFMGIHYYFRRGSGDEEQGNNHFEKAVALTAASTGLIETATTGRTLYIWAYYLRSSGDDRWFDRAAESQAYYRRLPWDNPNRTSEAAVVDELLKTGELMETPGIAGPGGPPDITEHSSAPPPP